MQTQSYDEMKWNSAETWQFPGLIMLALLGGSQETQETQIDDSFSSVFWKEGLFRLIVDRLLSRSNLRKKLQVLGSAVSLYSYILLFNFCLLINRSHLLIIPLPGTLHKAILAEKAILAPPKQLQ